MQQKTDRNTAANASEVREFLPIRKSEKEDNFYYLSTQGQMKCMGRRKLESQTKQGKAACLLFKHIFITTHPYLNKARKQK